MVAEIRGDKGSILRFEDQLDRFADKTEEEVRLLRKKTTFEVYAEIQKGPATIHPVDTGRALAGWAMSDTTAGPHDPPPGEYSKQPAPTSDPKNTAVFAKPFDTAVVYNRVPYIRVLEFGHPGFRLRKANHAFVRQAVANIEVFSK